MNNVFLPLIGGILIGISSSLILLAIGRITGISGILSGVLNPRSQGDFWKFSFLAGLISGGFTLKFLFPEFFNYSLGAGRSFYTIMLAGLFVGFGTRLGGGCTSGHGVCGIPRRSPRSIVATSVFFLTAILTVAIERILLEGL